MNRPGELGHRPIRAGNNPGTLITNEVMQRLGSADLVVRTGWAPEPKDAEARLRPVPRQVEELVAIGGDRRPG
jgi:hypothetical protein